MKTTQGMRVATVWKLCIEMWDWIEIKLRVDPHADIVDLKEQWCRDNGYTLQDDCFFCDVADKEMGSYEFWDERCHVCPAKKVAPQFECKDYRYAYRSRPLKFHAKLHRMNKKRLKVLREKRKA